MNKLSALSDAALSDALSAVLAAWSRGLATADEAMAVIAEYRRRWGRR